MVPECNAGLFSATQTEAVQALARAGLRNPVRINVAVAGTLCAGAEGGDAGGGGGQKTPSELSIRYLVCDMEQKLPYLLRFLQVKRYDQFAHVVFRRYHRATAPMHMFHMNLSYLEQVLGHGDPLKSLHPAVRTDAKSGRICCACDGSQHAPSVRAVAVR